MFAGLGPAKRMELSHHQTSHQRSGRMTGMTEWALAQLLTARRRVFRYCRYPSPLWRAIGSFQRCRCHSSLRHAIMAFKCCRRLLLLLRLVQQVGEITIDIRPRKLKDWILLTSSTPVCHYGLQALPLPFSTIGAFERCHQSSDPAAACFFCRSPFPTPVGKV